MPILTHGLKVLPWTAPTAARDMQLAELLKLTDQTVALVFRIPLQILGITNAPFSSTQALMSFWLASGLGFCLNHIEEAFGRLSDLAGQPDEYCEFSTAALLRSDQKDRIDALARGVQGGVYSVNEARNMEDLPTVEYGDEPRLQAQMTPVSAAAAIPSMPSAPAAPAAEAAVKSHQAAVQADIDALAARARRPASTEPPSRRVICRHPLPIQ